MRSTLPAVSLVLIAALLFLHLKGVDVDQIAASIALVPTQLIFSVLVLSLANYVLRFLRWEGLLESVGYRLPRARHMLIYVAGFSMALTPGKAGEAVRSIFLAEEGVNHRHSIACVGVERLYDVISVAILAVFVVSAWPTGALYVTFLLPMALALAFFVSEPRVAAWMRARVMKNASEVPGLMRKVIRSVVELVVAATEFPRNVALRGLPIGLAGWLLEGIGLWLLASQFEPELPMLLGVGIFSAAILVGALTFLPGGLGGTEVLMTTLLAAAGLSVSDAVAATAVCRLATLWFGLVLGILATLVVSRIALHDR
jgi:uncharacterized protein (TIRG00374 family)